MKKYEALMIVKPDLSDEEKKVLSSQLSDAITKNDGSVSGADIWAEKRKLYFTIKKYREGVFYLVNFSAPEQNIAKINHAYRLNENILRTLITKLE